MLAKLFEELERSIQRFNKDPEVGVKMLGTGELGCYYGEEDAKGWLRKSDFVNETRVVDRHVLGEVVKVWQGAGVVDNETTITK
jgi:hypothetical protein